MRAFIETKETEETKGQLLKEFEVVLKRASIQTSPYHYVVTWFEKEYKGYESYFEEKSSEEAAA